MEHKAAYWTPAAVRDGPPYHREPRSVFENGRKRATCSTRNPQLATPP